MSNGILFKPDMIKAIMDGRKTVTRRLSGLKEINKEPGKWVEAKPYHDIWFINDGIRATWICKPRYLPGETVYVREAHQFIDVDPLEDGSFPTQVEYRDGVKIWQRRPQSIPKIVPDKWRSPRFMPEWAARTFLKIKNVRPERLWEITEADILKEGCPQIPAACGMRIQWYQDLWDSINPKFPYSSSPWVFRYEFEKTERPK